MSTRWWAPSAPSVEVDEATLAMLAPGSDPEKDIGLYLLAAHRAGAGALTHMAKSSIGSETSLITALGVIRPTLSDGMVDALAPITGATYAGLLVRDVLDEADQGALDVYRSAVSKGVAPPIALERAAAAYVLPSREMGAFTALATDPKTNPRAVEDAADRSLMTYVAKVAAQEATSQVSKAAKTATQTQTETEFDRLHPRGADGQFVETPDAPPAPLSALDRVRARLGLLSTEPAKVAETTKAPVVTDTPAVAARKKRQKRAATVRATAAARAPAAQRTAARAPAARRTAQKKASRKTLNRLASRVNANFKGKLDPDKTKLTVLPDLLKRLPETGDAYHEIGQTVVISVSNLHAAGIRQQAGDQAMTQKDKTRQILRIGHMTANARSVDKVGVEQAKHHTQAAAIARGESRFEYTAPEVEIIEHRELMGSSERENDAYIDRKIDDMVTVDRQMPNGDVRPVVDYSERGHVLALPVYEPLSAKEYDDLGNAILEDKGAMAVVHLQASDPGRPNARPVPTIEEYVILTDARGAESGTARQAHVNLDPNQIYEIVHGPDDDQRSLLGPDRMWDVDNMVVVNRWYLRPLDDYQVEEIIEVEKALAPAQARVFEALHPRDQLGQFAETATETETTTEVPVTNAAVEARHRRSRRAAKVRAVQASRIRAVAPTAKPAAAQAPTARRTATRTATRTTHPLAAALSARIVAQAEKANAPILSDTRKYKLLREQFFQNLFPRTETSDEAFAALHRGEPLKLTNRQRLMVAHTRETSLAALPMGMARNVNKAVDEQRIQRERLASIPLPTQEVAVPDYSGVSEQIDHILRTRPDLDVVELGLDDTSKKIEVWGSKVSGSYQNVIEFDPDLNMAGELYLTFHGEHRAADMLAQGQDATYSLIEDLATINVEHDGVIYNPYVHYYRLTSAPVRRFRMDNG